MHRGREQAPRRGQPRSRWAVGASGHADGSAIAEHSAWVGAQQDLAYLKREFIDVQRFDFRLERLARNAEFRRRSRGARDPSVRDAASVASISSFSP